jgi:hypothetical protein
MRKLPVTILLALGLSACNAWSQSYYYVFDGNSLSLVRQDPTNVSAPKWAAFYFKKGRSAEINNRWGVSEKKTPAEVLKSVESNQKFERQYERWCGCGWGEETFFNVIAPVAMRESPATLDPLKINLLNKAHETWDEAQELIERFNHAAELSGGEGVPKLRTGPLAEFMKNVHDVVDRFQSIQGQITQYSGAALQGFEARLNEFARSVGEIQQTAPQAFQTVQKSSSVNNTLGSWAAQTAGESLRRSA